MPTKGELEDELNEMLDTNMDWSEMKKEDLNLLVELVEEGALLEPMAKVVVREKGKDGLEEIVDEWDPGFIVRRLV